MVCCRDVAFIIIVVVIVIIVCVVSNVYCVQISYIKREPEKSGAYIKLIK